MSNSTVLALAGILYSAVAMAQESIGQTAAPETLIELAPFWTNVWHDQKPIYTFPYKAIRGEHWKAVLGVTLGTAGLVALDPYTERFFHDRPVFDSFKTGPLRGRNTTAAVTLTPVALYLAGLAKHSTHTQNTGILAAE